MEQSIEKPGSEKWIYSWFQTFPGQQLPARLYFNVFFCDNWKFSNPVLFHLQYSILKYFLFKIHLMRWHNKFKMLSCHNNIFSINFLSVEKVTW